MTPRPSDAGAVALLPGDDVEAALETKEETSTTAVEGGAQVRQEWLRLIKPVAVAEPRACAWSGPN